MKLGPVLVFAIMQDMGQLAALVGQALSGSELRTSRAWSLLTADDMGLRLGLISLEANTFERNLTIWADHGWVVDVFGASVNDTIFRNQQVWTNLTLLCIAPQRHRRNCLGCRLTSTKP